MLFFRVNLNETKTLIIVPASLRDGPLFFWRGGGGRYEKFSSANIFFLNIYVFANIFQRNLRANNFFSIFFSVLFLFVLNITIALLNYFTKNKINSAIATYFVDIHVRSTHLLKFFGSY